MYIFYADESGFSQGSKFEPNQPVTVVAGVLIDRTKLFKAIRVFEDILYKVNQNSSKLITEFKFTDIKQNKYPYNVNYPKIDDKADLLESIITSFKTEISFKVFFSAIDDAKFLALKKAKHQFTDKLHHPYLVASYRVLSRIQQYNQGKKNNKGKTFTVFDEQNKFQDKLEMLVNNPIHLSSFTEIIDTAYFGKSHYSKLIQIADLMAGIIRFHLTNLHLQKSKNHFNTRIENIFNMIMENSISKECFKTDLKNFYGKFEK